MPQVQKPILEHSEAQAQINNQDWGDVRRDWQTVDTAPKEMAK